MKAKAMPSLPLSPSFSQVDIETYCSLKQGQIVLTLASNNPKDVQGEIVQGKPVFCNHEFTCKHKNEPKCLLNAIWIETRK
jgi:hypothetical protein